jgi:cytochrome c556
MRIVPIALGSVAILACGAAAISQTKTPPPAASIAAITTKVSGAQAAAIMKARHDGMESMGKDLKTLHRDLDSDDPNVGEIRSAAADIYKNSKAATNWFPAGTGPEAGKTAAKPEIWQNPQDFAVKLALLQHYADEFYKAAITGDVGTLKANEDTLSGACKACHDIYRAEEKH